MATIHSFCMLSNLENKVETEMAVVVLPASYTAILTPEPWTRSGEWGPDIVTLSHIFSGDCLCQMHSHFWKIVHLVLARGGPQVEKITTFIWWECIPTCLNIWYIHSKMREFIFAFILTVGLACHSPKFSNLELSDQTFTCSTYLCFLRKDSHNDWSRGR